MTVLVSGTQLRPLAVARGAGNQSYRKDVDGLRAIAVCAVVFCHAKFAGFAGGYLGVDIFFVISGFLITRILLHDADGPGISIVRFYERRVRRIIPALTTLLLACTVAALCLLSPFELKQYAYSLASSTGFVANFYFMFSTDYWMPRIETPLLHLWSLSVEEQFYLIYPLFLAWQLRVTPRPRLVRLFAILIAGFLVFSEVFAGNHLPASAATLVPGSPDWAKSFAFYFTGSRAWELLLGGIVAISPCTGAAAAYWTEHRRLTGWIAAASLLMIAVPIVAFSDATPWPGLYALLPCVGTAALLWLHESQSTLVRMLLGSRPFVWVGLISYSLYLWHWPVFEFYTRWTLHQPNHAEYTELIALTIPIAWASWRYIERPFRVKGNPFDRKTIFRYAAACGALLMTCAGSAEVAHGFPARFAPPVQQAFGVIEGQTAPGALPADLADLKNCYVRNHAPPYSFSTCFVEDKSEPNVVVWGDSFVGNFVYGFREAGLTSGVHVIAASQFDCRPVLADNLVSPVCAKFNHAVVDHLDRGISAVVISARFFSHREMIPALRDTARLLAARGIKVVIIGPPPEYREPEPLYVARYLETGDPAWIDSSDFLKPGLLEFDAYLRSYFSREQNVRYVSVLNALCRDRHCPMVLGGLPIQSDFGHLTVPASRRLGQVVWAQFADTVRTGTSISSSANALRRSSSSANLP